MSQEKPVNPPIVKIHKNQCIHHHCIPRMFPLYKVAIQEQTLIAVGTATPKVMNEKIAPIVSD